MKKAVRMIVMIAMLGMIGGCGKSAKDKLAEQYQEELGLSKEEADAMADFAMELQDSEEEAKKAAEQALEEREDSVRSFRLEDPKSEIINSKAGDLIVQFEDFIIPLDGSMTVADVKDAVGQYCGYEVPVTNGNSTEYTEESIESEAGYKSVCIKDAEGKSMIYLTCYVDAQNGPVSVFECPVYDVGEGDDLYSLNLFYAGNICAGTYAIDKTVKESETYLKRIEDYPALKYDEVEDYIKSQGMDYTYETTPGSNIPVHKGEKLVGETAGGEYRCVEYRFEVDETTASCSSLRISSSSADRDVTYKYIKDFNEIPDELWTSIMNDVELALADEWFYEGKSAELVGYFDKTITEDSSYASDSNFIMVFKTDKGEYFEENGLYVSMNYAGEIVYEFYGSSNGNPKYSLEEFFEMVYFSDDMKACFVEL